MSHIKMVLGFAAATVLMALSVNAADWYRVGSKINWNKDAKIDWYKVVYQLEFEVYEDRLDGAYKRIRELESVVKKLHGDLKKDREPRLKIGDTDVLKRWDWDSFRDNLEGDEVTELDTNDINRYMTKRTYDSPSARKDKILIKPFDESYFESMSAKEIRKLIRDAKKTKGPYKKSQETVRKIERKARNIHKMLFKKSDKNFVDILGWLIDNPEIAEYKTKGIFKKTVTDTVYESVSPTVAIADSMVCAQVVQRLKNLDNYMRHMNQSVEGEIKSRMIQPLEKYESGKEK